jgi:hypothetical protein
LAFSAPEASDRAFVVFVVHGRRGSWAFSDDRMPAVIDLLAWLGSSIAGAIVLKALFGLRITGLTGGIAAGMASIAIATLLCVSG